MSAKETSRSSVMVKTEKPKADANAAEMPAQCPSASPLATMMVTPVAATPMQIQVSLRTDSPNTAIPRTAVMNGAEANKNMAAATDVN